MGVPSPYTGLAHSPALARLKATPDSFRSKGTPGSERSRKVSDLLDCDDNLDLLPAAVMDVGTFVRHDIFEMSDAGLGEAEDSETGSTASGSSCSLEASEEQPQAASHARRASGWLGRPLNFGRVFQAKSFWELAPSPREHQIGGSRQRSLSEPNMRAYAEQMPSLRAKDLQCHFSTKQASWNKTAGCPGALIVPARVDGHGNFWEVPSATPMPPPTHFELACAPPLPPRGSFAPEWTYAHSWPFSHAPTSLRLGSLPAELTQEDLLEVLDKRGFSGFYDFVFVPTDAHTGCGLGYAIVNLTRHTYGLSLAAQLHGFNSWGISDSEEPCEVEWSATFQGLAESIGYFREHAVDSTDMFDEGMPLVFSNGFQVPFPKKDQEEFTGTHLFANLIELPDQQQTQ